MDRTATLIEHVNELRRRPGTRREVHRAMPAAGLKISTAGVPDGAEVTIDGILESIPDGIVVEGLIVAPWEGECRRCLAELDGTLTAELREVFETHPIEGETWPLHGDELDLAPMLRDTVLLALPLAPLCSPDCLGPAPDLFPALASSDAPAEEADEAPVRDPRWAALDQLRSD